VGIPTYLHGPGVKFTDDIIPDVEKQTNVMAAAADAGKLLGHRLSDGHDRTKVAKDVQEKMMAMFGMAV
jgi:hypothetical protein